MWLDTASTRVRRLHRWPVIVILLLCSLFFPAARPVFGVMLLLFALVVFSQFLLEIYRGLRAGLNGSD